MEPTLPAVGSRVRCEGLKGAAELNGCVGRVLNHAGDRARVKIDGGRVLGVKAANLVVVAGPGEYRADGGLESYNDLDFGDQEVGRCSVAVCTHA